MPTRIIRRERASYSRNVPVGWPINTQMYDLARHSDKIPTFPVQQPHYVATHNMRYILICAACGYMRWAFVMPSCMSASPFHIPFAHLWIKLHHHDLSHSLWQSAWAAAFLARTPYSSGTHIGKSQTFYRPISGKKKIQYT